MSPEQKHKPHKPSVPWEFSKPVSNDPGVPNTPTPEGRLLGAQLARLADLEEEGFRQRFPRARRRCGDCALRAGTHPNGCVDTLMDVIKSLVEGVPFYCHKGVDVDLDDNGDIDNGDIPLCAGCAILLGADLRLPLEEMAWVSRSTGPARGESP